MKPDNRTNKGGFDIKVLCSDTSEHFKIKDVTNSTKVLDLKIQIELIAGIPTHLQRVMYLDGGDMEDHSTLRHHDVVDGAQLTLCMWNAYSALVKASAAGLVNEVLKLGVDAKSNFQNANVKQMNPTARVKWFRERASVALYIAAHRGHVNLIQKLLSTGVDLAATTKHGRNVLHFAASGGKNQSVDALLANGAGDLINVDDNLGQTPLQVAAVHNHKSCERRLFLFQWRKRAIYMKKSPQPTEDDLMAHQLFDSKHNLRYTGKDFQTYQCQVLRPQEFQGSGLSSKRSDNYVNLVLKNDKKSSSQTTKNTPPSKRRS